MQITFDTLSIAQAYVDAGLSIIPIRPGSKEPAECIMTWKAFQKRRPEAQEIRRWFSKSNNGIAVLGGKISGGLVIIDLESEEAYTQFQENAGVITTAETIEQLPVVATGKGFHIYFRCDEPAGNKKLAMSEDREVIAETRGEGGYVLAPPTIHPSGRVYELIQGEMTSIPHLTQQTAEALLDAARALAPQLPAQTSAASNNGSGGVIDAFNANHTIEEVLSAAGYKHEHGKRWIRPGGDRGSIIVDGEKSIHFNSNDPLFAPAPGGGMYAHTPFSAWCKLHHNDEVKAAVKSAAQEMGIDRKNGNGNGNHDDYFLRRTGRVVGLGQEQAGDTWPYFLFDGGIWMHDEKHGQTVLCNFEARIIEETVYDDGESEDEYYTIHAHCSNRGRTIKMTRQDFESETAMGKIAASLGARARINPRAQLKFIQDAIKTFSQDVKERHFYTYTGWVGEKYMFGNGYVDSNGWHASDWCDLPRRLKQYNLNPTATIDEALSVLDHLLQTAPIDVVAPLVGGIQIAPIKRWLKAAAPMIHICGTTGSRKTALSCAAMCLYGMFAPAQPTDTWSSTMNSVQKLGWHLKDAPLLLDDYKIKNVKPRDVTFLLQNYGDQTARGRLDANSTLKEVYPVRGVIISSGEDQPEGEASTLARILTVNLRKGDVELDNLSLVQDFGHYLHTLTVDYIQWLTGATLDAESIYSSTRNKILQQLETMENATNPGRVASNIAVIVTSWEVFLQYIEERGHWSLDRIEEFRKAYKRSLYELAKEQLNLTTQERYSQVFIEAVSGLLVSGRACLLPTPPESGQTVVGYQDDQGVWLICNVVVDEVARSLRSAGRDLGASSRAISQMLYQDNMLLSVNPPNLRTRKRINGTMVWCWHLKPGIFEEVS